MTPTDVALQTLRPAKSQATRLRRPVLSAFLGALAYGWLGAALLWVPAQARGASPEDVAVQKTLKPLVNAIRYNKNDLALKQVDLEAMSQKLMGEAWAQMDAAQHKTFTQDLSRVLAGLSFSRGREIFQYLDAVLYAPVSVSGTEARCKSTVVIHRDLKKKEMPIEWVLHKDGDSYKVVDTLFLGESTTQGVREEQVLPLLNEGGVSAVMKALAEQVKALPSKTK